jgi:hypothetical protein
LECHRVYRRQQSRTVADLSKDDFEKTFGSLATELGTFKKYDGSQGQAGIHIEGGQKTITAEYVAAAEFQNGVAQVAIRGIKENGGWKILNFNVNVPKRAPAVGY